VDFDRGFSASAGKSQCNQHCEEEGRSAIAETSGGAAGESALAPSLCAPIAFCRMACHGWPVVLQARHREQDPGPCSAERCTNASGESDALRRVTLRAAEILPFPLNHLFSALDAVVLHGKSGIACTSADHCSQSLIGSNSPGQ
jgi:hypothetical protein